MNQDMLKPELPWWRVPTMWFVVGGPAAVVVASIVTGVVAWRGGDRPLLEAATPQPETLMPATQARNHAAAPRR